MFENKKIALIGTGNMAEAVIRGLLEKGLVQSSQLIGSNISASRNAYMASTYGIETTTENGVAVVNADVVVLGVKPQIFGRIMGELGGISAESVVISIMAGVTIDVLHTGLQHEAIVRAMPNTPAQIGQGMSVWVTTPAVTNIQKEQAQAIFSALGAELFVNDEKYLDMSTALNGSGPAYVFLMLESMIDAGVRMGFSRDAATKIVIQTFSGSLAYAEVSDLSIIALRQQVTSPGGTTAAALYAMEKANLRTAIADGVWAAYQRSLALGQQTPKNL